jgi:hypothetical protein
MSEESAPDPEFTTAAALREEAGVDGSAPPAGGTDPPGSVDADPRFAIPARPERHYPARGGVEYRGGCVFEFRPRGAPDAAALLRRVLEAGPYRYGDWFDLPMPLYLVHDDEHGDTYRAAVRDGGVEVHVRPETTPAGVRALYERLDESSRCPWAVRRRVADG